MDLQKNPDFLLGQLVATAFLLRQEMEQLRLTKQINFKKIQYTSDFFDNLDPHEACYRLMEQEIHPYKEFLQEEKHHFLIKDLTHIYHLKVQYDFTEDPLDEHLYQFGYESQIKKYRKDV